MSVELTCRICAQTIKHIKLKVSCMLAASSISLRDLSADSRASHEVGHFPRTNMIFFILVKLC